MESKQIFWPSRKEHQQEIHSSETTKSYPSTYSIYVQHIFNNDKLTYDLSKIKLLCATTTWSILVAWPHKIQLFPIGWLVINSRITIDRILSNQNKILYYKYTVLYMIIFSHHNETACTCSVWPQSQTHTHTHKLSPFIHKNLYIYI